jgi:hypothetical protein
MTKLCGSGGSEPLKGVEIQLLARIAKHFCIGRNRLLPWGRRQAICSWPDTGCEHAFSHTPLSRDKDHRMLRVYRVFVKSLCKNAAQMQVRTARTSPGLKQGNKRSPVQSSSGKTSSASSPISSPTLLTTCLMAAHAGLSGYAVRKLSP